MKQLSGPSDWRTSGGTRVARRSARALRRRASTRDRAWRRRSRRAPARTARALSPEPGVESVSVPTMPSSCFLLLAELLRALLVVPDLRDPRARVDDLGQPLRLRVEVKDTSAARPRAAASPARVLAMILICSASIIHPVRSHAHYTRRLARAALIRARGHLRRACSGRRGITYHMAVHPRRSSPRHIPLAATMLLFVNTKRVDIRRRARRHAAAVGAARRPGADRHQVRLRHGAVRRLHRAHRRPADALVRHAVSAVAGAKITTIEGVEPARTARRCRRHGSTLDVPQCGYCQSGQIMTASALLARTTRADRRGHRRAPWRGNVCRCATYVRIRAAIHEAAKPLA